MELETRQWILYQLYISDAFCLTLSFGLSGDPN